MPTPFKVEYVNGEILTRRREEINRKLLSLSRLEREGAPLTRRDLDDLAAIGALDSEELDLYDELEGIEFMLNWKPRG